MNFDSAGRATRSEIHERIRQNFRTLSSSRISRKNLQDEPLDDSLTNLQWLWNLNVNINNPMGGVSVRGSHSAAPCNGVMERTKHREDMFQAVNKGAPGSDLNLLPPNNNHHHSSIIRNPIRLQQHQHHPSRRIRPESSRDLVPINAISFTRDKINPKDFIRKQPNPRGGSPVDPMPSEVSPTPCHYSLSPREAAMDVLPGQVDYKNNAYVRPPFSCTSLIYMALNSSKRNRMTLTSICKWIKDNFIYYRYADPSWQKTIEQNLTQNKHFSKVQRKRKQPSSASLWQIDQCNSKPRGVAQTTNTAPLTATRVESLLPTAPHSSGMRSKLLPPCSIITSSAPPPKPSKVEPLFVTLAGRKRKQPAPQKIIRRRIGKKIRNGESASAAGCSNNNLLEEQAPELGSLKGDFNWNSVFDEFFGAAENNALNATPSSSVSTTTSTTASGEVLFPEDVGAGAIMAHDALLMPASGLDSSANSENEFIRVVNGNTDAAPSSGGWQMMEKQESLPDSSSKSVDLLSIEQSLDLEGFPDLGFESCIESEIKGVDNFLLDVGDLDLTVQGRQIEPPEQWIPVSPDLDQILGEKSDDNFPDSLAPLVSPPRPPSGSPRIFRQEERRSPGKRWNSPTFADQRCATKRRTTPEMKFRGEKGISLRR